MIKFENAVKEVEQMLARHDKDQWRLAEIAANLELKYGDQTLENFAAQVGLEYGRLRNLKATWIAWKEIEIAPKGAVSIDVARQLNAYGGKGEEGKAARAKLAPKLANMTQDQAVDKMREWKVKNAPAPQPESKPKKSKKEKAIADEKKKTDKIDAAAKSLFARFTDRIDRSQTLIEQCERIYLGSIQELVKSGVNIGVADAMVMTGKEWLRLAEHIRRGLSGPVPEETARPQLRVVK